MFIASTEAKIFFLAMIFGVGLLGGAFIGETYVTPQEYQQSYDQYYYQYVTSVQLGWNTTYQYCSSINSTTVANQCYRDNFQTTFPTYNDYNAWYNYASHKLIQSFQSQVDNNKITVMPNPTFSEWIHGYIVWMILVTVFWVILILINLLFKIKIVTR